MDLDQVNFVTNFARARPASSLPLPTPFLAQDETAFFESSWDPHSLLPLPAKAMEVLDGELRGIVAKARSFDDCVAFPVGTVGPMHVLSVSRRSDGYGPLSDSGNTTYSKLETEVNPPFLATV